MATFGRFERRHDESRTQRGLKTGYTLVERPQEQWVCIEAPALVDEGTWGACQEKIKTNRSSLSGRADRKYLLSGLMRCPQCGEKMRAYRMRRNPKNKDSGYYHLYECRFARPASNMKGRACHNKQYRGYWAEPLVTRAIEEFARRPELAFAAIESYKRAQVSEQVEPDAGQLRQQLAELHKQEQATIKAQIAGILAGADSSIYETALRDLAAKRTRIAAALTRAEYGAAKNGSGARKDSDANIITRAVADVSEVLNAPDNELTPAEKQGLLTRVIEGIYPEGTEGLKIHIKPPFAFNQSVAYFTT